MENHMSLQCYILSGVSGAGKSTWIQNQSWAKNADIHSADDFFVQEDGSYRFDPRLYPEAFNACLLNFLRGVRNGWHAKEKGMPLDDMPVQVVDNTNTTAEEVAPYYACAKAHGYEVTLINLLVESKLAAERNQHDVPLETIQDMQHKLRNRKLPKFWKLNQENYIWSGDEWTLV
jgi:predicted kinase